MTNYDLCGNMPEYPILAYSYTPIQRFEETYTPAEGLLRGTLFPALDKPLGVYGREYCKTCREEEVTACDAAGKDTK